MANVLDGDIFSPLVFSVTAQVLFFGKIRTGSADIHVWCKLSSYHLVIQERTHCKKSIRGLCPRSNIWADPMSELKGIGLIEKISWILLTERSEILISNLNLIRGLASIFLFPGRVGIIDVYIIIIDIHIFIVNDFRFFIIKIIILIVRPVKILSQVVS